MGGNPSENVTRVEINLEHPPRTFLRFEIPLRDLSNKNRERPIEYDGLCRNWKTI